MGRIAVLDANMVNMIAAGEVIERPASVVKELIENSIDAGATRIRVDIEDGGRKLIAVADNGCGMDREDLERAFESHSTSKIRVRDDLDAIATLGFRGEALASIASVGLVRAVSRPAGVESAHCLEIDCGVRGPVSPCSADVGTAIEVRDIFYKLPARRKFLRTANTELGHVTEQFTRIALAHPRMELTLTHKGRELYRLESGEPLRTRIGKLFAMLSADVAGEFIEADGEEKGMRIRGLLGGPGLSRTTNRFQYVFLNGRYIRDKFISHAVREAYRGLLEPDRHPVVFLFIEMPYEDYDVNVHPTKIEVRFYNSNLVHSQVLGCLRERLLAARMDVYGQTPAAVHTSPRVGMAARGPRRQEIADAMADFFRRHKPMHTQGHLPMHSEAGPIHRALGMAPVVREEDACAPAPPGRRFIQLHDSYIVAQEADGFVIIDQHALHERIMYERLSARVGEGSLESQRLLIPESFEVTEAEAAALEEHAPLLERMGLEVAPFGPRVMAVQAFATLLGKADPVEFVRELLDLLLERQADGDPQGLLDAVLNMAACKAAIKAGQRLRDEEIEQLLTDAGAVDLSSRCPHGRPTTIRFTWKELEKQFRRT